jgi:hypothetical protein
MKLAGPLACVLFNIFMKTDEGLDGFRIAMMLIYYQIVYTQGMFD